MLDPPTLLVGAVEMDLKTRRYYVHYDGTFEVLVTSI